MVFPLFFNDHYLLLKTLQHKCPLMIMVNIKDKETVHGNILIYICGLHHIWIYNWDTCR